MFVHVANLPQGYVQMTAVTDINIQGKEVILENTWIKVHKIVTKVLGV